MMSDQLRVVIHAITYLAFVVLVVTGHTQEALFMLAGNALPSPVSTAIRVARNGGMTKVGDDGGR